jgi:hypothetical protein
MSRISGSGNIQLTLDNASFTTVTLTTADQVFSINQAGLTNPNFGIRIVTNGDSINATQIQLENVVGQSNQNPSEYVSVGVLSSPFQGANVDGVQYYATQNGNSVSSNVVTEATGALISSAIRGGFLPEPAATDLLTARADAARRNSLVRRGMSSRRERSARLRIWRCGSLKRTTAISSPSFDGRQTVSSGGADVDASA